MGTLKEGGLENMRGFTGCILPLTTLISAHQYFRLKHYSLRVLLNLKHVLSQVEVFWVVKPCNIS
jgi:hypothetical protein